MNIEAVTTATAFVVAAAGGASLVVAIPAVGIATLRRNWRGMWRAISCALVLAVLVSVAFIVLGVRAVSYVVGH